MLRLSRSAAAFAFVALAVAAGGCVDLDGADLGRHVDREEKHFTTTGKPDVTLGTFDGSIEIRPWDKAEVSVIVEKRGRSQAATDAIEVRAEQTGNRITVDATVPRSSRLGWHFGESRAAKLIVQLPASSDVNARSGDGAIDIDHVSGKIVLHSGDGRIKGRSIGGDVNASTGDGSITLDGTFDALRAHSGDGSLHIQAARGSAASGDWEITTGDGSVTVEIPDGFNADLDAHTGDGRIRLDDVSVSNVQGEIRRNSVRGRIGSGGGSLRIRSGDGSIILRRGL